MACSSWLMNLDFAGSLSSGVDLTNAFGLNSPLTSRGLGLTCLLSSAATGVQSTITDTFGTNSIMSDQSTGVTSTVDNTGKGVESS